MSETMTQDSRPTTPDESPETPGLASQHPVWSSILCGVIVAGILITVVVGYRAIRSQRDRKRWIKAGENLVQLGKALRQYAADFGGTYPTPHLWCDLLTKHTDISPSALRHPLYRQGPCDFALNPNAEPNSPGEMIVLFETAPGWNQYGTQEILKIDEDNMCGSHAVHDDHHHVWVLHNAGHAAADIFHKRDDPEYLWQHDPNE